MSRLSLFNGLLFVLFYLAFSLVNQHAVANNRYKGVSGAFSSSAARGADEAAAAAKRQAEQAAEMARKQAEDAAARAARKQADEAARKAEEQAKRAQAQVAKGGKPKLDQINIPHKASPSARDKALSARKAFEQKAAADNAKGRNISVSTEPLQQAKQRDSRNLTKDAFVKSSSPLTTKQADSFSRFRKKIGYPAQITYRKLPNGSYSAERVVRSRTWGYRKSYEKQVSQSGEKINLNKSVITPGGNIGKATSNDSVIKSGSQ